VKSLFCFLLFFVLIMGCATGILQAGAEPKVYEMLESGDHSRLEGIPELKEIIVQNRKIKYYPEEKVEEMVKPFLYSYEKFKEIDPEKIPKTGVSGFDLSKSEIIEDIEILFQVLKYGYVGYEIQGGDQVFLEARESLISWAKDFAAEKGKEAFFYGVFEDILIEKLSFINDWHFKIGQERLYTHEKMHFGAGLDVYCNRDGFYLEKDGKKAYLISCNGNDPEKYLKPSLNPEGELVYRPVKLAPENNQEKATLLLEQNGERWKKSISLIPADSPDYFLVPFAIHKENDITVITSRNLSRHFDDDLRSMVEKAGELRDEDLFILDLRGNTGGSTEYVRGWVKEFSSQQDYQTWGWGSIDLCTQTSHRIRKNTEYILGFDAEWVEERFSPTATGWSEVLYRKPRKIENDVLIFVLIDDKIASAAEAFLLALREMENVVFVGSNTAGGFNMGNYSFFHLPHSGVFFQAGVTLFFPPEISIIEGTGFAPDIWVEPSEAMDKTLTFIERYLR